MKKIILVLLLFLFSSESFPAGTISGSVKSIQARESGNIEISLEENHSNPDECAQAGKVVIENNHLAKKEIVSFVLAAMAQSKKASFYVSGCLSQYSTTYPKALTGAIIK